MQDTFKKAPRKASKGVMVPVLYYQNKRKTDFKWLLKHEGTKFFGLEKYHIKFCLFFKGQYKLLCKEFI